jgi:DNA-binding MarR family transcriptional regulator
MKRSAAKTASVLACSASERTQWPHGAPHADPAHEAWRLFFRLVQESKEHFATTTAELDLSPVQARVLLELDPSAPLPMSALAGVLSCDASNVTGLVDRLESRGLIVRRAAEGDRRIKALAVTEKGEALRRKLLQRIARPPPPFRALSANELRELSRLLRKTLDRET